MRLVKGLEGMRQNLNCSRVNKIDYGLEIKFVKAINAEDSH